MSQTVARMERDGLLSLAGDRHLELTDEGRLIATRVMRKHRLAERLLVDVIGLEWEYVHEEACRWEHVMSERVERKILAMLDDHRESPYGNPIPGLDELGARSRPRTSAPALQTLTELAGDSPEPVVVVRRIGEPVQVDHEALSLLTVARAAARRARRGCTAPTAASSPSARARRSRRGVSLPDEVAQHVFGALV